MLTTYERSNDAAQDKCNNVCPSGQSDVVLQHNDKAESKADNKNGHVPPPWRLLVVFDHVCVVAIIEHALTCALVRCDDVLAQEEDDVHDESTNRGICHEKGVGECSREPWKTVLSKSSLTEDTANKDLGGRV